MMRAWDRLLLTAGLFAAAELVLALTIGGFFALGRAEALVFHAFRPWLLLLLVIVAARHGWRERAGLYAAALLLATAGECLLLLTLGADGLWAEAARGLLGGTAVALLLDLLVQLGRRLAGRYAAWAGPALAALLLIPVALPLYDRLLLDPAPGPAANRPELMLMTALPIVWGDGGAFDPRAKPAESYRALEREFRIRPVDSLTARTLGGRLLLLAQPRALAPDELVALDSWVRRGGRALILTDPLLLWPSELPLGDARRAPRQGLLAPLLAHWGLELIPPKDDRVVIEPLHGESPARRLVTAGAGRFLKRGGDCLIWVPAQFAHCPIGKGQAWLVADADLMRDDLWAPAGAARPLRTADNPLLLADWLDRLAGLRRRRVDGAVTWLDPEGPRAGAAALGLLPAGIALLAAAGLGRRRRA